MNKDLEKKKISDKQQRENVKESKEEFGVEVGEDCTKYGEFISSYFAWIPLQVQKEKAEEMQEITKKSK